MANIVYPFVAIVGQEKVKQGLLIAAVNPAVGGALLCGEKGTAKSTMVRALAEVAGQKVVELPLNITEDRLVGAVDFEHAIKSGETCFYGGVLEKADGQILYVDEMNLLPEGITNALLAAASGENIVEREGISFRHDCRFTLIGTMNPEEGSLRPQLLDKMGLYLDVKGEQDAKLRAEIIRRRLLYENDPQGFIDGYKGQSEALSARIEKARRLLSKIQPSDAILRLCCEYVHQANAEGNRCELMLLEAARAVCALDGRESVTAADIKTAAAFVLPHRRREAEPPPGDEDQDQAPDEDDAEPQDKDEQPDAPPPDAPPEAEQDAPEQAEGDPDGPTDGEEREAEPQTAQDDGGQAKEELTHARQLYQTIPLPGLSMDRVARMGSGRRSKTKSGTSRGRYARSTATPTPACRDIALDATIRAAAPYQRARAANGCAIRLEKGDIRYKVRESHIGATIFFVVDASGSMGASQRMQQTKEAILSLLLDSYQKRDKVGLVAFGGGGARTILEVTSSIDLAQKQLQSLPTGGKTPLAAGLFHAWQFIRARRVKDPEMMPMLLVVTDGRANEALWTQSPVQDAIKAAGLLKSEGIRTVVIDTEKSFVTLGLARKVASAMDAVYWKVDKLQSGQLGQMARHFAAETLQEASR